MGGASSWARTALDGAAARVFWSDVADAPEPSSSLRVEATADLVVIGAGYTGLWAAIQAAEEQPGRRIVVLEAETIGFGASSRNGGFCAASLTHGLLNGLNHWPDEIATLERLGHENLHGIEDTLVRHGAVEAADFFRVPALDVATAPWQVAELAEDVEVFARHGHDVELLDAPGARALVDSPTYVGGLLRRSGNALVDPARMGWALRSIAESLGVTIHEHSPVADVEADGAQLVVRTPAGSVRADRVVMATNAYPGPLRRPRRYVVPVYDHVLMTEPLSSDQLAAIGWSGREGIGDAANQFHYYRLSADDRILWGGYDATYHFNNAMGPQFDQSDETHGMLAEHFFATFPQLEGLRFTHRWGGPIATTTQFCATWGTAHDGRMAWVSGYTGLGVGASRFGARVALDLVDGLDTERTELQMVRSKPFPFPPEPARWIGVQLTRRAIQRADDNEGRRGPWLRLLDRFGVGFDS
jgi:glycine/D-amino acid oxidase-like deaminating enzyme